MSTGKVRSDHTGNSEGVKTKAAGKGRLSHAVAVHDTWEGNNYVVNFRSRITL